MAELSLQQVQQLKSQGLTNNQIIQKLQQKGHSSSEIFDVLSQTDAPSRPQQPPPMSPPMPSYQPAPSADTEEMIEAIIDEKWNDLMTDINKVIAWKESTEARLTKLEQRLDDVSGQFDKLHQAIVGKIGEYDQHILDVGAEVKAMEKVFSKVLPIFTDNVAELARISEEMRAARPKPKKK